MCGRRRCPPVQALVPEHEEIAGALPMTRNTDVVAITGIGVISPLGRDLETFESGLRAARSCLQPLRGFEIDIDPLPMVAEISDSLEIENRSGFRLSRTDKLAILAAQGALAQANPDRTVIPQGGACVSTTVGGLPVVEPQLAADPRRYFRQRGLSALTSYQHGHVADAVACYLGLRGPRLGVSVACASGSIAIAIAARMVLDGTVPFMLAGGSEALCAFTVSGFHSLQALDSQPCRPFDLKRNGLNLGEGAAMLVLEPYRCARDRGARIFAVLRGWGMTNDAFHPTAPHEEGFGLAESMLLAMRMAGVGPDQIGYVNAHGTGTPLNDAAETKAYETVFRNRPGPIPVSSTKSYIGHNLAAAGALEAVITILGLRSGVLFPTLRLKDPIPSPTVDWVMGVPRHHDLSLAMSASAGFGGSNSSLLFGLEP
jgi:3-oxoacyl-[acyl-carrier-protein] synthase II